MSDPPEDRGPRGDRPGDGSRADGDAIPDRVPRWGPATAFAALVLVVSLVPIPGSGGSGGVGGGAGGPVVGHLPSWVGLTDPFHLVGYAVLGALITLAAGTDRRGLVVAVTLATGFGFGVELAQATIPWRTFAWSDVAVNAVGAVAGASVASLLARRRASRETGPQATDDSPP